MKKLMIGLSVIGALAFTGCTNPREEVAEQREELQETRQEAAQDVQETRQQAAEDIQEERQEAAQDVQEQRESLTEAHQEASEEGARVPAAVGEIDCAKLQEDGITAEEQALWDQHCAKQ